MPYRLKYPEAPGKRDHYRQLAQSLRTQRQSVSSNLKKARTINAGGLTASGAEGAFCNLYHAKKDVWIGHHTQVIQKFDTFLSNLDACIAKADSLANEWAGKAQIMEEYDDD